MYRIVICVLDTKSIFTITKEKFDAMIADLRVLSASFCWTKIS